MKDYNTFKSSGDYQNDYVTIPTSEARLPVNLSSENVVINDPTSTGTILSSVITISNTILGSGMLTIPYALSTVGLVNGILAITIFGAVSFFGLYLLIECANFIGGRRVSFFSVSKITYPKLSMIFDLAIAIKCFGVSVSYLVIVGELMPKVTKGLFPQLTMDSLWLNSSVWITIGMFLIIPLSFKRSLDSLKYASTVSLIAIFYIMILVVYFFFRPIPNIDNSVHDLDVNENFGTHHKIEYFKWNLKFFNILPIFVFAFTCHQNIFSIFNEMKNTSIIGDNREKKSIFSTILSICLAVVLYFIIGIVGYLTFGDSTQSNIISMYPASNTLILIGQMSMALMVSLSYPLQCHPSRRSLGIVIKNLKKRDSYERLDRSNSSAHQGSSELSTKMHATITSFLLLISYIIACSVGDLSTVLSVVGATGSTTICYILPGLLYYKIKVNENQRNGITKTNALTKAALMLSITGVFLMFICLFFIFVKF